jgi:uncharacterized protein with FMN-binding domain
MSRTTSNRRVIATVGLGAAVVLGQTAAIATQASASTAKTHASSSHHKADKSHHAQKAHKAKKHHHETETDGSDDKVGAPAPAPSTTPAPAPAPTPTSAPAPAPAVLVNGTFTGKTITFSTPGGNNTVAVTITLKNSVVTNATATWGATDSTSKRIITGAVPTLNSEAIKANSASIATVSNATLISDAYTSSLQDALTSSHR